MQLHSLSAPPVQWENTLEDLFLRLLLCRSVSHEGATFIWAAYVARSGCNILSSDPRVSASFYVWVYRCIIVLTLDLPQLTSVTLVKPWPQALVIDRAWWRFATGIPPAKVEVADWM